MCAIQRNNNQTNQFAQQNPDQPQRQQMPQQQEQRYRFRWPVFVGLPIAGLVFFWFISGMEVVFSFDDIMDGMDVIFRDRFILLGCLGIACVAALLIIKVIRK